MYANTYICNLKEKNGSQEPRGRTDVDDGVEDTGRGKGKLGRSERVAWTYIYYQI